jgi:RNA polymerase primary sigma factor
MNARPMPHRSSPSDGCTARSDPIARARRILGTRLKYIDHAGFDDPDARDAILILSSDSVDDRGSRRSQPSEWPAPLPASRSGAPLLSREREADLFCTMNYLKYRANQLREQLDPDWPNPGHLDEIEWLQTQALALKNRIVELNLPLVISIARARVRVGYELSERISDGNLALIQAVDGFDFARGNKFSTYATWAIRNKLAREERKSLRLRRQPFALYEESLTAPDAGVDESERQKIQDQRRSVVRRWFGRLEPIERRILASRYGIGGVPELTLKQLGQELGISKERVRQIAARAQAKLREFARLDALELLEI